MTHTEPLPRRTLPDHIRRATIADAAFGIDAFTPLDWLAKTGASAAETLTAWADGKLVDVEAGTAFDVVTMPFTPGWDTIRHLRSMHATLGPILHTPRGVHALVGVGEAAGWDLPESAVMPAGATASFPHPSVVAPHTRNGCSWIVAPRPEPVLTDVADLYGAYAAALVSVQRSVLAVS